ncbi:MAG: cysteine--tRNA ligase [Pseudomonadota bacterium]
MPELQLYNSLTRKKEPFVPIDEAHVRLYACGPTVYNYAHIGNARMAVVFDLLNRVLKSMYPKVTYVSNITDVDDKIMAASEETGEAIDEITAKYTKIYNDDMGVLGVDLPDIQPRATETISEMIEIIQTLIEKGHAYESDGHALFHVPSFENYGGLSGRSRDEQIAGARVEVASYKKDPADFVLWKPSLDSEPGWDSPWGRGRPGWHIECSAMSAKHLGLPFDIHGGGADLKFPHHENEIAQSCCAADSADDLSGFAKFWVHNGFVTVEGEKMSKSLGNVQLVHDLIEEYKGPVLRLALLSAQYSKPLDWTKQRLSEAARLYEKIQRALHDLKDIEASPSAEIDQGVMDALMDDLNTPLAVAKLNELLSEARNSEGKQAAQLKSVLAASLTVLGVQTDQVVSSENPAEIEALIEERQVAKDAKDWARADEIRNQLTAQGIEIEDTPSGTTWRRVS